MEGTKKKEYNLNLDILRIVACLMVLTIHIGSKFGWDARTGVGAFGTHMFFILSGFLSMGSYEKICRNSDKPVMTYYKNRMKRILPLYYGILLLHYIIFFITYLAEGVSFYDMFVNGILGYRYLRYFLFIQCIFPATDYSLWCNMGNLWCMSAFALFYLLVPAIYKYLNNYKKAIAALLLLLVINIPMKDWMIGLLTEWPETSNPVVFSEQWAFFYLYCFMFGVCIYYAIKESKEISYSIILLFILFWNSLCFKTMEIIFVLVIMLFIKTKSFSNKDKIISCVKFLSGGTWALYLSHNIGLSLDDHFIKCCGDSKCCCQNDNIFAHVRHRILCNILFDSRGKEKENICSAWAIMKGW